MEKTGLSKIRHVKFTCPAKTMAIMVDVITYIFIALFIYTATDKLMNLINFQEFMVKMVLMNPIGNYVAILIPVSEIFISLLLLLPKTKHIGLYTSCGLMVVFTAYLVYVRIAGEVLPCHCGGVISSLTWTEHIYFNIGLIVLALTGIKLKTRFNILKQKQLNL